MDNARIDIMTPADWDEVAIIYSSGIASGNATFEQVVPDWEKWNSAHRKDCRFVAKVDGKIAGWAALSNVSDRCVYSGVAEVSIYVDPDYHRRGIGDRLMKALIMESEIKGVWTLQAGIFPENISSISLHQKNGFRIVGVRERLGKMGNVWRDVLLLERRSLVTGII